MRKKVYIKDIPILREEWDFNKNKHLDFSTVTSGKHDKVWWKCKNNHEWEAVVYSRYKGNGCRYCRNQEVLIGFNDMWTTNPQLASNLLHKEDGYKYTTSSGAKVDWKCSDCSYVIKSKKISDFHHKGLYCPNCDDGISYPEKFMMNLLNSLSVDYTKEKSFDWSKGKRYDFFIEDKNTIIEVHGVQHYKETNFSQIGDRSLVQEQKNDILKKNLALGKVENYIVIDARVADRKTLEENVKNSLLSTIYCLDKVDFQEVDKLASKKMLVLANELWEKGFTSGEIVKKLMVSQSTVLKYLKKGSEIGISSYSKETSISRHRRTGNDTPSTKLTGAIAREIVELSEKGWDRESLSEKFGVHKTTITRIRKGRIWSEATGISPQVTGSEGMMIQIPNAK